MKNTVQTFARIVSDNACGKSHLLCTQMCTIHRYSLGRTGKSRQKRRKDERAPSNQRSRAGQRPLCGDDVWEEARQNCLHRGKAA